VTAAQKIRRVGFRKWYEGELLRSHAHLVLLLLSALGLFGAAEVYGLQASLPSRLQAVACAIVSAAIGIWALRRYLYLLNHAEFVADQAVCRQCDSYAKWDLVDEDPGGQRMRVCCRKCGTRWHIAL